MSDPLGEALGPRNCIVEDCEHLTWMFKCWWHARGEEPPPKRAVVDALTDTAGEDK